MKAYSTKEKTMQKDFGRRPSSPETNSMAGRVCVLRKGFREAEAPTTRQRAQQAEGTSRSTESLFHAGVCVQRHTSSEHNPQSTTRRGLKAFTLKVDTGLQHVKTNNKWSHTSNEHNPQSCRLQHWCRHPRNFVIAHFRNPNDRYTCPCKQ